MSSYGSQLVIFAKYTNWLQPKDVSKSRNKFRSSLRAEVSMQRIQRLVAAIEFAFIYAAEGVIPVCCIGKFSNWVDCHRCRIHRHRNAASPPTQTLAAVVEVDVVVMMNFPQFIHSSLLVNFPSGSLQSPGSRMRTSYLLFYANCERRGHLNFAFPFTVVGQILRLRYLCRVILGILTVCYFSGRFE